MSGARALAVLVLISLPLAFAPVAPAQNPVSFVNQPLIPDAVAPGGPGFTRTVNGASRSLARHNL